MLALCRSRYGDLHRRHHQNPSFEVNSAPLSRASVYVLQALDEAELGELFARARTRAMPDLDFSESARTRLIGVADGDARRLLNLLEQLQIAAHGAGVREIDGEFVAAALAQNLRFDKGGDAFYDQISALHKSVRGSHPDAALYWFCRMDGGADPRYLARRIVRMAWEDIGLADPRGARIALDAVEPIAPGSPSYRTGAGPRRSSIRRRRQQWRDPDLTLAIRN